MNKLLNPIEFFNDRKLLISNLIIFVVGTTISILMYATFESPIDLHFTKKMIPLETLSGNLVAIIALLFIFFLSGKIINKKVRFIDCLNLALFLRMPYYILTLLNLPHLINNQTQEKNIETENFLIEMIIGYSFVFFFIAFLFYQTILIYKSFTTITNAKKTSDYLILIGIFLTITILSSFLFRNI